MNILLITNTNFDKGNTISLIPIEKFAQYDLNQINNGSGDTDNIIGDQIRMLFDRLGIEEYVTVDEKKECQETGRIDFPFKSNQDLKKYLNPREPFTVDKVIKINWMNLG